MMLESSLSVQFLLKFHRHCLSWMAWSAMKAKLWLRQPVKAFRFKAI